MAKPQNIFETDKPKKVKLKRNRFDLSHFNNMTMSFGKFYPNLVIETIPQDSFTIKTSAGFNLMPTAYPLQTPIYFNQYFFKVRNRSLWKEWKSFITGVKTNLVPPYLGLRQGSEQAVKVLTTGSLGDYMNIPTINESSSVVAPVMAVSLPFVRTLLPPYRVDGEDTLFANWMQAVEFSEFIFPLNVGDSDYLKIPIISNGDGTITSNTLSSSDYTNLLSLVDSVEYFYSADHFSEYVEESRKCFSGIIPVLNNAIHSMGTFTFEDTPVNRYSDILPLLNGTATSFNSGGFFRVTPMDFRTMSWWYQDGDVKLFDFFFYAPIKNALTPPDSYSEHIQNIQPLLDYFNNCYGLVYFVGANTGSVYASAQIRYSARVLGLTEDNFGTANGHFISISAFCQGNQGTPNEFQFGRQITADEPVFMMCSGVYNSSDEFVRKRAVDAIKLALDNQFFFDTSLTHFDANHVVSSVLASSPFTSSADGVNPPAIPISALPFRAYESIFNSYFRRQQVDPLTINGEPEYEKFVRNTDGGEDNLVYDFFERYWESDFLTSCLPSPQQGVAPLIGVTSAGTFTFRDENDVEYTAQAVVGEDGETLTGIDVMSPDIPSGSLKNLMNYIDHGISINDIRNVNALQKYLETNLRCGYRYRDLMKAHHGITIRFDELDMPEYIGGFSAPVSMSKIINSDAQGDVPLGQFAGLGSVQGTSKYSSHCFCDEHGFIIGICSLTPVPIYSQLLPKHFFKNHFLDYYTHEFAKIGYQPVTYKEVTPVNRYNESLDDDSVSVHDVFGYQRAWYEYMSMTDEAHGDFRTISRNYLLYRMFGQSPELSKQFITIDKNTLNDVFASHDSLDKFTGQIYFDIVRQSQILRNITPAIE